MINLTPPPFKTHTWNDMEKFHNSLEMPERQIHMAIEDIYVDEDNTNFYVVNRDPPEKCLILSPRVCKKIKQHLK
jgi:hypothetical protein